MSTTIPGQRRVAGPSRRLTVALITCDCVLGVFFVVMSFTALSPGRALAIGCGAVIALLSFHLPVIRLMERYENAIKRSSGFRAVALTAACGGLLALSVLWILGIGALARMVGMPTLGRLCDVATSLHSYYFAVAAIFVLGCTAWQAIAQAVAWSRRRRAATTDDLRCRVREPGVGARCQSP